MRLFVIWLILTTKYNLNTLIIITKKKGIHPLSIYISEAGLYTLILSSRLESAKTFKRWVTHDIIPSIRKYGYYQSKTECNKKIAKLKEKNDYLINEKKRISDDCKKNHFPSGGIVYAINYSTKYEDIYRIGMTANMNKRKTIYDTHTLHNHKVVLIKKSNCPSRLESCIRAMLRKDKYYYDGVVQKDFYVCSLSKIKSSFDKCHKIIESIDNQCGGNNKDKYYTSRYDRFFNHMINDTNIKINTLTKMSDLILPNV